VPHSQSEAEDAASLRAEWLQDRSRLFDRDLNLPALPSVIDDVRRMLEDGVSLALFTFTLNAERQVEEIWGFQAYDKLIADFVKDLRGLSDGGLVPAGILCVPAVRSDEILSFIPLGAGNEQGTAAQQFLQMLSNELESFVRKFL
jgi:hypothetical protein